MVEIEGEPKRMQLGTAFQCQCCTARWRLASGAVYCSVPPCTIGSTTEGKYRLVNQYDGMPIFFRRLSGETIVDFDAILLDPATARHTERLVLVDGSDECYVEYNSVLKYYDVTLATWEDHR